MQKLRVRYAKRGRLRFTSHRDVARTFERALRRAGVPMAYSMGFSPHPKVSWVGAAPTGVASEAEYVEIQVVEPVDPDRLAGELDAALPPGLDVLEVVQAGPGSLPERIEASRWRLELPGVPSADLRAAVSALLAAEQVEVERMTKNGRRPIDARAAVVSAEVLPGAEAASISAEVLPGAGAHAAPTGDDAELVSGVEPASDLPGTAGSIGRCGTRQSADWRGVTEPYGILEMVVRQTTPAVRPDDVLSALRVVAGLVPPVPAKAIRMAQGRLDDSGRLVDPFAADKAAPRPAHTTRGR